MNQQYKAKVKAQSLSNKLIPTDLDALSILIISGRNSEALDKFKEIRKNFNDLGKQLNKLNQWSK